MWKCVKCEIKRVLYGYDKHLNIRCANENYLYFVILSSDNQTNSWTDLRLDSVLHWGPGILLQFDRLRKLILKLY